MKIRLAFATVALCGVGAASCATPAEGQEAMPVPPAPRSRIAVPSERSAHDHESAQARQRLDDNPVGREFVPAMPLPEAPPGTELLMQQDDADDAAAGLTLDALLSLASQNNPTLLQARQHIQNNLAKALQAGLCPNPTLSYIGEQIFVDTMRETDTPGEFQGASIRQEFVTADKLELSRSKYLHRAKAAEWLAVAQQWRVCNDVRIHFWRALGQQQIVHIRRELLKSAEDAAVTSRELYNLGQDTRADLHLSNVMLQRERLALLQAENMYRSQFRQLTSFAGLELDDQRLQGDLEAGVDQVLDFEAVLSRTYAESPELLAAQAKRRGDIVTIERERVEPIPNVFVEVGTGRNFEAMDTTATARVSIEVPIFDRNQGTIWQAQTDLVRQNAEIRRTELRLRRDLAQQYQEYLTALQHTIEFQTVVLPEARAAYLNQLDAYKEDRQNWGDVLRTQQAYYNLREQYVQNLVLWRTSEVLIKGFLLHGGLEAAPDVEPPGHIDAVPKPR